MRVLSAIDIDEATRTRLQALGDIQLDVLGHQERGWQVPDDLLHGPEVLLFHFPPSNLTHMSGLKFVQLGTVGYEHLRQFDLGKSPVRVCNARGVYDTAIGEWNIGMMINLNRDVRSMIRNQEQGRWERADRFQYELRGQVVGFWGYGGIGRETARLCKAFGMTVHVMTRSGVKQRLEAYTQAGTGDPPGTLPDRVFVHGQVREFLAGLDFLVLSLPRTRHTDGMVGTAELRTLPRTAFVLNPARGAIIQEFALLQALREGWVAGAALDTHYAYPLPAEHPLWRFPNVILTPHIAGAEKAQTFHSRILDLFYQNLNRYLTGTSLLNELTKEEWAEVI